VAPEGDRRFFGDALRIGFNSAKKLLDLFKGLPIAMRDVTSHFRLHSFTPNTCRVRRSSNPYVEINTCRRGKFRFRKSLVHHISRDSQDFIDVLHLRRSR
jgi:hypothetical protein